MKVWTYHPGTLDLLAPGLVLDARLGQYMHDRRNGFIYATVRPRMLQLLPTDQFLWCVTKQGDFSCTEENYGTME
jgi:hypothetical protein